MNDDSHPSHAARDVDPTVLDHIRPTVVVRRRMWEPPPELRRPAAHAEEPRSAERNAALAAGPDASPEAGDDDEAPPSSLFLAPESLAEYAAGVGSLEALDEDEAPLSDAPSVTEMALAPEAEVTIVAPEPSSLRLVAEAPPSPAVPAQSCPTTRTVHVGEAIAVASLADAMGRSSAELVAELITRGFFEVNARTALPRKVASAAARAFGWEIEPPEPATPEAEESAVALRLVERRRPIDKPAAKTRPARTPVRAHAAKRPAKPAKKTATAPTATKRRKTSGKHAKRAA